MTGNRRIRLRGIARLPHRHRRTMIAFAAMALMMMACSCNWDDKFDPSATKTIVVFYDRSESTAIDRSIYAKAMEAVVDSLHPGDRLVIGPITATSVRDFVVNVDFRIPPPLPPRNGFTDREADYRKAVAKRAKEDSTGLAQLAIDISAALATPSDAQDTAILETMSIAEDIFGATENHKVLILLSDMLETSEYNFEKTNPTPTFIEKEIARLSAARLVPDLQGVHVHVVGARAADTRKEAAVEDFWQAYFMAAGAVIGPGQYARAANSIKVE